MAGVAVAGSGATFGVLVLPNGGARVTPSSAAFFRGIRAAVAPIVPEGTKGEPAANFRCCLTASQALGLAVPEGTKALLPAAAAVVFCTDAQDLAARGLVPRAVPEGIKTLLPAPAAIFHGSGDSVSQDSAPGFLDIAGGLLAVPVGSTIGGGLRVRCCPRPAVFSSAGTAGGRGLLSVSVPKDLCWGLLPAANRHVMVARCSANSNPLGENPRKPPYAVELGNLPRTINATALVGHPSVLEDVADSATIMVSVIKDFTPLAVDFVKNEQGPDNDKMDLVERRAAEHTLLTEIIKVRAMAFDMVTALEMVRSEAVEGYIREETLITAITKVRVPAERTLRSKRFGDAIDLLPTPYAGTAAKAEEKVAHFKKLATELRLMAIAMETGLRELLQD